MNLRALLGNYDRLTTDRLANGPTSRQTDRRAHGEVSLPIMCTYAQVHVTGGVARLTGYQNCERRN